MKQDLEKLDAQNIDFKDKITALQERMEINGTDTREIKRIMLEKNTQTRDFQEKIADLTEKLVFLFTFLFKINGNPILIERKRL